MIDSSSLIQAHRAYYPFDVFPSFWDKIGDFIREGKIHVIDKVYGEIMENKDKLSTWLHNFAEYVIKTSEMQAVIEEYGKIARWVNDSSQYNQAAKDEFLGENADPWVIAYASVIQGVVITQEVSAPESKRDIKIPDVCNEFNVEYCNVIEFLRKTGVQI